MTMDKLRHCILTGFQFEKPISIEPTLGPFISYDFVAVGKVNIALPTLIDLMNKREYKHPILAGICRNAFENKQEPPMITTEFILNDIKNIKYPKSFKEKYRHLLKYMYDRGGNDFKTFLLSSTRDYPICFSDDREEFQRIMEYLEKNYLIEWKNDQTYAGGVKTYWDVQLTDDGIEEVEKELPKIPMIGLVSQNIATGDSETDDKINHAKDLFFQEPQTTDRMRSACEALSYVLEPLRNDLKKYFIVKDTEDFFQLVNSFDIRHNKPHTKDIEHLEQLEWIFYSLLNTINAYTKLKKRLG